MFKKLLLGLLLISACVSPLYATSEGEDSSLEIVKNEESTQQDEPYFKVKPIVTLFEQFQQGLGSESGYTSFEHHRGYVGLNIKARSGWHVSGIFDIVSTYPDSNDKLTFNAYLKNLELGWGIGNLSVVGGIIKTKNFELKESYWGHRYVMSSFEDRYSFSSSADLGVTVEYKIGNVLSLDASLTNGKGYRSIDLTGNYRYGFGATVKPFKDLVVRAFYDHYSSGDGDTPDQINPNQINTSLFVGYKLDKLDLGAEYNYMVNKSFVEGANAHGFSLYSTYHIFKWLNAFGRTTIETQPIARYLRVATPLSLVLSSNRLNISWYHQTSCLIKWLAAHAQATSA
ncbi:MAG: hypothetical protein SNG96_06310 [Rikenellaceae bacterium]